MAIQNAITFVTLRGTGCTSDTQLFTSCKVPELKGSDFLSVVQGTLQSRGSDRLFPLTNCYK
jgi:hypothetical protein